MISRYIILALTVAVLVATGSAWQYRRMFKATDFALKTQNAAITEQNLAAKRLVDKLAAEVDAKQEQINKAAKAAKDRDAQHEKQLAAMRPDPDKPVAPVRVRLQSCDAGRGGAGTIRLVPARAKLGTGASATSTGLLDEAAARQFGRETFAVEELQRDFNLCQDSIKLRLVGEK